MAYTVNQVAKLANVSVRTLHHYDAIGLLSPSRRSDAGYRLYAHEDLERLQQVLFFRELGFGLDGIGRLMGDPAFDRAAALRMQREMLSEKARRIEEMIAAVDHAIAARVEGRTMDKEEMFEVFGDFDPAEYEDEVKERWGGTDAYKESARRTARYGKADWLAIKAEGEASTNALIAAFDAGLPPESAEAMDAVELHRMQIDKWFYPCSREMHATLGEMYVADPRFKANYEKMREGLAVYARDAIRANARRAGGARS